MRCSILPSIDNLGLSIKIVPSNYLGFFNNANVSWAFDIANENWALNIASENWALMLPLKIGL